MPRSLYFFARGRQGCQEGRRKGGRLEAEESGVGRLDSPLNAVEDNDWGHLRGHLTIFTLSRFFFLFGDYLFGFR